MKKSMLILVCGAMVVGACIDAQAGWIFSRWRCRPRTTYQTQAPQTSAARGSYQSFSYEPGAGMSVTTQPATSQPDRPRYLDAGHKVKGKFGAW